MEFDQILAILILLVAFAFVVIRDGRLRQRDRRSKRDNNIED
jgi:preprotein translocase subunit YajC